MSNELYFCINCGYILEQPYHEFTEIEDIIEKDLEILNHFTQIETNHEEIVCDECTNHYFHTPLCPICHEYGDYCRGHGFEEEKAFGDCPICEEAVGAGADPEESGCWCRGHSLLELREHYANESTTEN